MDSSYRLVLLSAGTRCRPRQGAFAFCHRQRGSAWRYRFCRLRAPYPKCAFYFSLNMDYEEIARLMEEHGIDKETAEKAQELIEDGLDEDEAIELADEM